MMYIYVLFCTKYRLLLEWLLEQYFNNVPEFCYSIFVPGLNCLIWISNAEFAIVTSGNFSRITLRDKQPLAMYFTPDWVSSLPRVNLVSTPLLLVDNCQMGCIGYTDQSARAQIAKNKNNSNINIRLENKTILSHISLHHIENMNLLDKTFNDF